MTSSPEPYPRLLTLQRRIAGLRSALPAPGKPSMAERGAMRWAGVPEEKRRAYMRDLARRPRKAARRG